ncbi:MAG: DNA cytosine methyltransferase [Alistipes sp.]|nr:DNA cytosine methyltransferase [Alistipes sp.]MBQ5913564.1 DNA cytosine methyltransferase [Alistipes sp.]
MTDTTICLNSKVDGKQPSVADRIYSTDGCSVAITSGWKQNIAESRYRIRKLTPRECFRLMGVDDADIDKIQASGISNSQQYKCAGNSIVVDVLYHLFLKMFCETKPEIQQPTLF